MCYPLKARCNYASVSKQGHVMSRTNERRPSEARIHELCIMPTARLQDLHCTVKVLQVAGNVSFTVHVAFAKHKNATSEQ